jgi:hypothetical protein
MLGFHDFSNKTLVTLPAEVMLKMAFRTYYLAVSMAAFIAVKYWTMTWFYGWLQTKTTVGH